MPAHRRGKLGDEGVENKEHFIALFIKFQQEQIPEKVMKRFIRNSGRIEGLTKVEMRRAIRQHLKQRNQESLPGSPMGTRRNQESRPGTFSLT